jgi:hypothetical protein
MIYYCPNLNFQVLSQLGMLESLWNTEFFIFYFLNSVLGDDAMKALVVLDSVF